MEFTLQENLNIRVGVIDQFEELIEWSQMQYHDLPWRYERSLYGTLVSEIMLQQTTVGTVISHFERFMNKFPTIHKLANAKEKDVQQAWRGLGYYRRAKNLHRAAQVISSKHQGNIPENFKDLIKIPGIGEYTANALISIGHRKRALAIDANIERVISRVFGYETIKGPQNQKQIYQDFTRKKILDIEVNYRALNEAIMDLGRTYCQARKASCELCPLSSVCKTKKAGNPLDYPREFQAKEKKKLKNLHLLRVLVKNEKGVLLFRRPKNKWLEDQYELPTFALGKERRTDQYPQLRFYKNYKKLPQFKTHITDHKISNFVLATKDDQIIDCKANYKYVPMSELENENISTATLKALERLQQ